MDMASKASLSEFGEYSEAGDAHGQLTMPQLTSKGFRGIKDRNSQQSGSRSGLLALVSGTAGSISPEWVALKVRNNQ